MNISWQASIKRQLSQCFRNLRCSSYTAEGSKQSVALTSASTTAVAITQESILPQEEYIKDIASKLGYIVTCKGGKRRREKGEKEEGVNR